MTRVGRLWVVLGLNLALVVTLVTVGFAAGSLGVWAAGVDYLADAAAIGVALAAMRLEQRRSSRGRANRWAATVNAGWLLVVSAGVAVASLIRLVVGGRHVDGLAVLVSSAVAAVVMAGGAFILGADIDGDDDPGDLSMRAVLLDTAADAAAAAGVALSGLVIWLTHGWYWLDPAAALVISAVVAYHALRLLADIHAKAAV